MTMAAGKAGHPLTPKPLLQVPDLRMEVRSGYPRFSFSAHTPYFSKGEITDLEGWLPTHQPTSICHKSATANCLFLKSQPASIDTYKLLGRTTYCFANKYKAGIKTTGSEVVGLFRR